MSKLANTDQPINDLLAKRWSPYGFSDKSLEPDVIRALFEAARWAPSSYNEQPWRYIVATKDQPEAFEALLSCLSEGNQDWAKQAPMLVLGIVSQHLERNGKPNRIAVHDLGLAAANLVLEATARELYVHQMAGIDPHRAREIYTIPEGFDAWTALAIGYSAETSDIPEKYVERDTTSRSRKPLSEFVFQGRFGKAAPL